MALAQFTDLDQIKGLGKLNGHLGKNSFIDGSTPSTADCDIFGQFPEAPSNRFANLTRWYTYVAAFTAEERANWRAEGAEAVALPEPQPPVEEKAESVDDDDFDFFGDDDGDDAAALEELNKARAATKKKGPVEKSNILFGVNPTDVDVDMAEIEDHCRSITMEGLEWKAATIEEVAFGIKKLKISMNIVDSLVSVDEVEELIQSHPQVTSTEICHFTKL
eukprot:TRINITY_DN244_c0_g1_i1.p1 TRINITY_DN244_c0_g1~~TRINITY_DN244_c0_g1_i1.p1  ORF type:complete len:220 (+),score=78.89 TRINITY_DN244_c0_g1_i1:81-740(+)